jgi:ABC-type amino acid transport substrate-binding protein
MSGNYMSESWVTQRHTHAGAEAVRNGDADAYVTDEWTLQWYAGRQPCDLLVQGDNFGPGVLVYGLQKDSPFTMPINYAMLEVPFQSYPLTNLR